LASSNYSVTEDSRISCEILAIPLFAEDLTHSSVPLAILAAVARSGGQGRP
jgi:hypothetical protein